MREKKEKIYLWGIIMVTVLAAIPLVLLSQYDHPSLDDYWYGTRTFQIWNDTHSVFEVIKAAAATSAEFYNKWQGTYVSAFIFAMQPGIFGEKYYALTGILTLGIIYGSNIIFAVYVLHHKLRAAKLEGVAFGCMVSFLMVQWIPSVLQGIYWFNGAAHYVLFYGILLLLICASLGLDGEDDNLKSAGKLVVAVLLAVILAGGNYVTAFMGILFLIGVIVWSFAVKKKKSGVCNIIVFFFMIACFIFNIASPGTRIRQNCFEDTPGIMGTIWSAVRFGVSAINQWIGIAIIVGMLLMLPFVLRIVKNIRGTTGFQFRYPLVVFVLSVGGLCAMLCPPIYAMGGTGDLRLLNIVYFSFILLVFLNEFYICGWLTGKLAEDNYGLSNVWIVTNLILVAGMCIGCMENSASYQAFLLLKTGEAMQYSREADERYAVLIEAKGEDIILKAYTVQPWLLCSGDITEDASDWKNQYMKEYFQVNSVVIEE